MLVNNLGGLGDIEIGIVVMEAGAWLAKKNITVERFVTFPFVLDLAVLLILTRCRATSGPFLTALDLPGFSITLLLLPRDPLSHPSSFTTSSKLSFDKQLFLDCFDAPTDSSAWPRTYPGRPFATIVEEKSSAKVVEVDYPVGPAR